MTRKVFILGTSHKLQCGVVECGVDKITALEREIRRVLSKHGIGRIAEEMSDDALREITGHQEAKTLCQRVFGNDLPVRFVDLGKMERACLSLSNEDIGTFRYKQSKNGEPIRVCEALNHIRDEVRERVWVARILTGDEWPVLFVCGAEHAVSVSALFNHIGVQATVICRDFDP